MSRPKAAWSASLPKPSTRYGRLGLRSSPPTRIALLSTQLATSSTSRFKADDRPPTVADHEPDVKAARRAEWCERPATARRGRPLAFSSGPGRAVAQGVTAATAAVGVGG